MTEDLKSALQVFTDRLKAAEGERAELEIKMREKDREIENLKKAVHQTLTVLGVAFGEPISSMGITDAIRHVVAFNRTTPTQVREELDKQGFNLSAYQNPMASIYKILARLAESGELEVEREGWNTFYKRKPRPHQGHHYRRLARQMQNAPITEDEKK